jgi:ABC-type multidrug transport system fused ATPase/permease subunit
MKLYANSVPLKRAIIADEKLASDMDTKHKIIAIFGLSAVAATSVGVVWLLARIFPALPHWGLLLIGIVTLPISYLVVLPVAGFILRAFGAGRDSPLTPQELHRRVMDELNPKD